MTASNRSNYFSCGTGKDQCSIGLDTLVFPDTVQSVAETIIRFFSNLYFVNDNLIENLITSFKNNINQYKDIGCAWDVFKNTIREKTIIFCKLESQKRKIEIQVLEQKLKRLNVKKKIKKKDI